MPKRSVDLDVIRRYLAIYALAKQTEGGEVAAAERRMRSMEAEHPGLKHKAFKVLAIIEGADEAGGPAVEDRPIPDPNGLLDGLRAEWESSPLADRTIPLHRRILLGIGMAEGVADDVVDWFSAPLERFSFQASQPEPNARGELVMRIRVRPDDARRRDFRLEVADAVERRLAAAVRRPRRGRRGGRGG